MFIRSTRVFAGLDQRNFDLWENPVEGRVITVALAPFSTNAIAVRGPLLGSQNVENAVLEALVGKGRVFWTQLDATSLWGRDSSASTYLRNVFDYMLSGRKPYEKVMPLELSSMHWSIPEGREYPIDLTKQANRGFRDDGDGTGWTGQGENDFRNMPTGLQKVNGIPFRIIDPAKNNGKSCLIVRGTEKPELPARIDGIPVNAKLSRLFFLHTCAWKGTDAGCYRINYADGTKYDYMLIPGRNIGDWWNCAFLGDAAPGILRPNPVTDQVGTYMAVWDNPFPEKEIKTIDFLSAGQNTDIDYLPGRCPVPILVAMTGRARRRSAVLRQRLGMEGRRAERCSGPRNRQGQDDAAGRPRGRGYPHRIPEGRRGTGVQLRDDPFRPRQIRPKEAPLPFDADQSRQTGRTRRHDPGTELERPDASRLRTRQPFR